MRRGLRAAIAGVAGLAAVGIALPVFANTNQPIAQTGGASVDIPLMGTTLSVAVVLDTTSGDITSVSLTPPGTFVATKTTPSRVKFETTPAGTTVSVSTKKDALKIGVKSAALKDLIGAGAWNGDVFGTGASSKVPYTIGDDGSGGPTLAIGAPTVPAGVTATVQSMDTKAASGFGWHGDGGDGSEARGWVLFEHDGFRKILSISVSVRDGEDGTPGAARLSIVLKGRDIQRKPLADLVGDHTWNGLLCDNVTKATIVYTVAADGTVSLKSSTPTADVKTNEHGLLISFPQGDKVMSRVWNPSSGDAAVSVFTSGRHCSADKTPKTPPTVNTPTSTTSMDPNQTGDHHGEGDHHGDHKGDHKGGPTTTATPAETTTTTKA